MFIWICLSQCDRMTKSGPRKLGSPCIRVQVCTQCIPAVPGPTYCFAAWLQLPDHFSIVVLTQQQMSPSVIAEVHCSKTCWSGCRLVFLCLHTIAVGMWFLSSHPGAGRLCGLIYEWMDVGMEETLVWHTGGGQEETATSSFICVFPSVFHSSYLW